MQHVHLPRTESPWPAKFCEPERLQTVLWQLPKPWVFTHGVFDLLHRGHVQRLTEARRQGASLIVAIHTDASARLLGPGTGQPFNQDIDRAWVLAALESVSLVTCFHEANALRLLARVRPEIYVSGDEDDISLQPETRLMSTWGGRSLALPRHRNFSTTGLVDRIRHPKPAYAPEGLASVSVQLYDVTRS